MKYIIMCGGVYLGSEPKWLLPVEGEPIVGRTIRLLRENGIKDIAISTNNPDLFESFNVPILVHENHYKVRGYDDFDGYWCEAFYPTNEPTCYLFGDVVFSPIAIETIIETQTDDIEFFASAPPFSEYYTKHYAEPFALKVINTDHLHDAIEHQKQFAYLFKRKPLMWELWQVIKGTPFNKIDYTNYTVINDYTCDVDGKEDLVAINKVLKERIWQNT